MVTHIIPKQFQIFGHIYKIRFVDDLFLREDIFGDYDPDTKEIRIQSPITITKQREITCDGKKTYENVAFDITPEIVMETYYHETFHAIFDAINEHDLFDNEKIVGNIGEALLQINQTSHDCIYEYKQ